MSRSYLQHGRRHLPEGSDPIPAQPIPEGVVPAAIYTGAVGGDSGNITIDVGANGIIFGLAGCVTNDPDTFRLKGAAVPYKGDIPSGYYYWLLELVYSDNPAPQIGPIGADVDVFSDYGQYTGRPTWNANSEFGHTEAQLITPGTDATPLAVVKSAFDGFINITGSGINDLEIAIVLENVANVGSALESAILNIVKTNAFLAVPGTIIP